MWLAAELVSPGVVTPFRNYAILGDDIVILDSLVAAKYRELLDDLGVQISPMKSLVSRIGALEFVILGPRRKYISPISLRLALLTRSPFCLVAFGLKYGVKRFSTLARLGGAGYRVAGSCDRKLSRHWERIRVMFGKPGKGLQRLPSQNSK